MRILRPALAVAIVATLAFAAVSLADPLGRTTLQETIARQSGTGYVGLAAGPGEKDLPRTGGGRRAAQGRAARRPAVGFFGPPHHPPHARAMVPLAAGGPGPAGQARRGGGGPKRPALGE